MEFDRLAWDSYRELAPGQRLVRQGSGFVTKHHANRLAVLEWIASGSKGATQVITSDVSDADD